MSREDISKRFSEYAKKRRAAEAKSGGQSGSSDWRDRYMAYKAKRDAAEGKLEASVGALGDRVSKWRENAGKYYTDYATRYDVEEGSYVYRGDTEDYLNGVTAGRDDLNREAESIRRELEFYKPYVSEEYYNYLIGALDGSIKGDDGSVITFDTVVDNATRDHDFYSQFEDEGAYKGAYYNHKFSEEYAEIDSLEKARAAAIQLEDWIMSQSSNTVTGFSPSEEDMARRQYLTQLINYYETKDYDSDTAEAEIAKLEAELSGYGNWVERFGHKAEDAVLDAADRLAGGVSLPRQGDHIGSLEAEISEKKAKHNEKVRQRDELLKLEKYESYRQNEDFAEGSKYVPKFDASEVGFNSWANNFSGMYTFPSINDAYYEYINGNYTDEIAYNEGISGQTLMGVDRAFYGTMTKDEISMYNYLYYLDEQDGGNRAEEYIAFISGTETGLKARQRAKEEAYFSKMAEDDPIGASAFSIITSPLKGMSYVGQIIDYLPDGEIDKNAGYNKHVYTNNAIRNTVSQQIEQSGNWGEFGSFAYGVGMSMGDFLFTTAISGGNSWIASAIMGASAAADTTLSGLNQGFDSTRAIVLGTVAGLAEVVTEKIGIDNLFNTSLLKKNWVGYVLKNALSEGGEEAATDLVNWTAEAIYDVIASQDQSEWKRMVAAYMEQGYTESEAAGMAIGDRAKQLGLDFAGGVISGGIMGGGGALIGHIGAKAFENTNTQKQKPSLHIIRTDEDISLGTKIADFISSVIGMQDRSKISKRKLNLGKLSDRHQSVVDSLMKDINSDFSSEGYELWMDGTGAEHIAKRHGQSGEADTSMSTREAQELIAWAVSNPDSATLIKDDTGALKLSNRYFNADGSKAPQIRLERVLGDGTVYVSECVPDSVNKRIYITSAYIKKGNTDQLLNMDSASRSPQPTPEASFDGSATINSISQESGFVNSENLSTPVGQANYYASILKMGENGTRGLVNLSANLPDGVDLGEAAQAFNAIYSQGKNGKALSTVKFGELLSPEQRQYAYNLGIMDKALDGARAKKEGGYPPASDVQNSSSLTQRDTAPAGAAADRTKPEFLDNDKVEKAQAKVDAAKRTDGKKKKGTVIYDGDRSKLSDMQKKSLDVLDRVAEALGVTFRIYESERVNGRFVYKMPDGVVKSANGWYDPKTGEIWLDINAGLNGEGTLIFTAAHELTHFIKQWSPAKFKIFADFLIEQYRERGISIDELVRRRIDKAKKKGEDIDPDTAYEEVIADSCETFLRDSNAVEKIAELNQKDASLAQKIKQFLRDMLKRLRELMKGMDPDSLEGKIVSEMTGSLEQLHKLWTDALADAGEAYSGADSVVNSEGGVKEQAREYDSNGVSYWQIESEKDIFKNLTAIKDLQKAAYNFILNGEKGSKVIDLVDGQELEFIRISAGEYVYGANSKTLSTEEYKQKMRISTSVIDLIENASISYDAPDHKNHKLFPNGFKNYQGRVGIDATIFKYIVRIGKARNGMIFYDICLEVDGKVPRANRTSLIKSSTSNNSISNPKQNINSKNQQNLSNQNGQGSQKDEMHSDRDPDALTNREILANLLETENMSPSEKGFLTKYKNKIAQIEANEAEISEMEAELKELRRAGKKDSSRAITLEGKIEARRKEIARDENMILNLESTKPIKELLKREKDAAYAAGMLAGQMAQGRQDAAKLRKTEEKFAEQKRKDGETLAEYKKRVAEREDEIKQKNREKLAEQREKARENLDAQAKRYQESRKKATEGRHKTAMRHKIADVVSELDRLLRKGTKERNVKIGLQDAVAAALEIFDLNAEKVERYNKAIADLDARIAATTDPVEIEALTELRDKKIRNSERLEDKLQVMKKAYEDIHNGRDGENYPSYYKAECEAIENRIAEVMEKVGDTPIGDMSLEQLEAVYDMYRMVLTTVQNANKVFKNGKLADLTADATDMTSELQRIKKLAEERLKAGDDIRSFVWNELTPYYAFNRIGSETLMSYYHELIRGQDVYARDIEEAQSFAETTRKKHGYSKWKLDQVHSFKDKDGRDFRLTLRHMMSIYAYSKREQAFDHMEKGGFFFNNKETFRKKAGVLEFIASNESGYKVDARIFAQIKGALTAEQIAYVDEMQAYLTKMGEKGNEVTRVMWGIDVFKEAVYFPLKSKEDFIYQANTPAETSSLKNDGMTKETRPHASNPIVLESFDDVWANHVEKMSKYHGFVIPIDNLNKLINYGTWMSGESQANTIDLSTDTELSTLVEGVYGSNKYKKIAQYILNVLGKEELSLTDGRLAIVDNSDALHIANKAASKKTAQIAKIRELVKVSELYARDFNVEHNKFDRFYYYKANVIYEGETFPIYLNVGRATNDGKYHIYDITNKIRDTADRINGLERPKPNEGYALTNGISNNSIPQESEDVNRNFSTNSEMGSHSISTMLEARFGPGVNDYLNTFIKDLNGAKAQSGAIATFATNLVSKFKKTSVAASLSVVVQQPTAILRALSEIDAKYFAHIPKSELLNKKWKRIQKYAPIAILKDIGGFDAGAGRQITEWINADTKRGVDRVMNKIDDITLYGAALGDRIGWSTIWTAVEREVLAKQKLDYGSEAFYEAVGKRFTDVIVKTQVYDSTLSRSGFMRGKDGLMKMATAFMGEPTLSINMMTDAILQAKRGKIKGGQAVRVIASVYAATVAASIAKSFIYALRDDDEDESYVEKYMQAFGGTILNDINPLNMLPIFRDIMSMLGGWEVERTDMALIQDLINAATALGSEKKSIYRKIEDFAGAFAALAGIPLKNVMRTVREMYNLFENIFDGIEGGSFGGALAEGITGKEAGKKEALYSALISGDPERIDVYRKTYDTEERYLSAVRQALREYDPRVQRAVEGALSGSYGVYNEMKAAVKAEKHFDVKTVNNAFADEKEYVLGKLNEARKARREGNTEEFEKIVQRLVERGYSEEFVRKKLK